MRIFSHLLTLGLEKWDLPQTDWTNNCKYSNKLLQGTPIEALRFTAHEFRSAVQSKFGVPQSRCLPIAGRPITNRPYNTPLRVGV